LNEASLDTFEVAAVANCQVSSVSWIASFCQPLLLFWLYICASLGEDLAVLALTSVSVDFESKMKMNNLCHKT